MLLLHPFFVERVYLHSLKMYLQVECTCLPLVNVNVFVILFFFANDNYQTFLFSLILKTKRANLISSGRRPLGPASSSLISIVFLRHRDPKKEYTVLPSGEWSRRINKQDITEHPQENRQRPRYGLGHEATHTTRYGLIIGVSRLVSSPHNSG